MENTNDNETEYHSWKLQTLTLWIERICLNGKTPYAAGYRPERREDYGSYHQTGAAFKTAGDAFAYIETRAKEHLRITC